MISVYLFAGLLALLVTVGLLVSPLLEREPGEDGDITPAERRDAEVEALREVEFEYRTGKLSDEDYRELRARHAEAAVRARQEARASPEDPAGAPEGRCPSCGAEGREDARYCSRCGSALELPDE